MQAAELPLLEKSLRIMAFILSAIPALYLLNGYLFNQLGLNPFERIMVVSGHSASIMLFLSLLITPLRQLLTRLFKRFQVVKWGKRLSDWNGLIRSRRMFGLFCFCYASIHLWCYFDLELSMDWEELQYEINTRKFIIYGIVSWVILLVLSITSPKVVQKVMKRWWRRVHRGSYIVAVLVCIHHLFGVKDTDRLPYFYCALFGCLLLYRFCRFLLKNLSRYSLAKDNGMEVYRSSSNT